MRFPNLTLPCQNLRSVAQESSPMLFTHDPWISTIFIQHRCVPYPPANTWPIECFKPRSSDNFLIDPASFSSALPNFIILLSFISSMLSPTITELISSLKKETFEIRVFSGISTESMCPGMNWPSMMSGRTFSSSSNLSPTSKLERSKLRRLSSIDFSR